MKTRLAALALTASLLTAACSEGPDNDQITAVPPKSETSSNPTIQNGQSSPARVELPEVPAPAAEEQVLDEVLDNTGE